MSLVAAILSNLLTIVVVPEINVLVRIYLLIDSEANSQTVALFTSPNLRPCCAMCIANIAFSILTQNDPFQLITSSKEYNIQRSEHFVLIGIKFEKT